MASKIREYNSPEEFMELVSKGARKCKPSKKIAEKHIQKAVLEYLTSKKIFHWRQNTQGQISWGGGKEGFLKPSSAPGAPDVIGVLPDGRALFIECKESTWKPPSDEAVSKSFDRWMRGETKTDQYKTFRQQRNFQARARANEAMVIIACSLEDVSDRIESYLSEIDKTLSRDITRYCKTLDDFHR